MSRIPPAREAVTLKEARLEWGEAPEVLACLAHAKPFGALWDLIRASLFEGRIPRTTKELVALAAVATAGVGPLEEVFLRSLESRGVVPEVLADLQGMGETERLPERVKALLLLGRRAALTPSLLADADFSRARQAGLDEGELAELLTLSGVLGLLIGASRALDCL